MRFLNPRAIRIYDVEDRRLIIVREGPIGDQQSITNALRMEANTLGLSKYLAWSVSPTENQARGSRCRSRLRLLRQAHWRALNVFPSRQWETVGTFNKESQRLIKTAPKRSPKAFFAIRGKLANRVEGQGLLHARASFHFTLAQAVPPLAMGLHT
jgi:hypothetical protein